MLYGRQQLRTDTFSKRKDNRKDNKMIGAALHDFNFSSQYPESSEFSSEKTPRDQKRPLFQSRTKATHLLISNIGSLIFFWWWIFQGLCAKVQGSWMKTARRWFHGAARWWNVGMLKKQMVGEGTYIQPVKWELFEIQKSTNTFFVAQIYLWRIEVGTNFVLRLSNIAPSTPV